MKTLERTRTVRLSREVDQRIEARASRTARTASDVIRETLEAEFSASRETAGQYLIKHAADAPDREPDTAFAAAYDQRHAQ
jgi:predicted DNA-binding protein